MVLRVLDHIDHLVTFDADDRELTDATVVWRDGWIVAVGDRAVPVDLDEIASPGEQVERLDGRGLIVTPGLVNAHQHITQVGFRSLRGMERAPILPWLRRLTETVLERAETGRFGPDAVRALAVAGFAESVAGGTTCVGEQQYHYPQLAGGGRERLLDAIVDAADSVGIRLNAGRGCLTRTAEQGAGAPPAVIEPLSSVIDDWERLIETHHDPAPGAMVRVDLAPCGVHTDTVETFAAAADLAARHPGVGLHTHGYEQVDTDFAAERGTTVWRMLCDAGWDRPGTWLAHMVDPPDDEIAAFAAAGVGVAHLVAPDLRMGWGLAPVRRYLEEGVTLGFGTTGSASNDGANLLGDLRVAALAHRMGPDPERWPTVRELLAMATRGSAGCLGRPDAGRVEVGAVADLAAWSLHGVDRVGIDDPVVGLVLTGLSDRAELVVVDGEPIVVDGTVATVDEAEVAAAARAVC